MTKADLLLHPVRLRILQAFLGDRALTTSQLQAELADVPASLYRHVAKLAAAGVLTIVEERRVRGALERTYTLESSQATVNPGPRHHRGRPPQVSPPSWQRSSATSSSTSNAATSTYSETASATDSPGCGSPTPKHENSLAT